MNLITMTAKILFYRFLLFTFIPVISIWAQRQTIVHKPVKQSNGEYIYSFEFPAPNWDSVCTESGVYYVLNNPGFEPIDAHSLPVVRYLLELPQGDASAVITDRESKTLPLPKIKTFSDISNDGTSAEPKDNEDNLPPVSLNYIGRFRDIPLFSLILTPYRRMKEPAKMEWISRMTVRIRFTENKIPLSEPLSSDIEHWLQKQVLNYYDAKKKHIWKQSNENQHTTFHSQLSFASLLPAVYLKLIVEKDGIYKITYQDLIASISRSTLRQIDPRTFRLFAQGRQVPIYVMGEADGKFDPEDYIEFFGESYRAKLNPYLANSDPVTGHYLDPWSNENTYFLIWGTEPGIRLIEENAGIISDTGLIRPLYYSVVKRFEEDNVRLDIKDIHVILPSSVEDIWAFDGGISYIASGPTAQSTKEYTFRIERPNPLFQQTDTLRINFQGISSGLHYVQVFINDVLLTPVPLSWSGQTKKQADILIPPGTGALVNGTNRLRIYTPPTSDRNLDMLALNWFEIRYRRAYQADESGSIVFNGGDYIIPMLRHQFEIREFKTNAISVYKKGISKLTSWDMDSSSFGNPYKITFQDIVHSGNIEYIAVEERAKLKPKKIIPDTLRNLLTRNHEARYLIITTGALIHTAKRLANHRQSRGLSVEIIDIQDIYDQFNYGVKSPYAIRDFLRYTQSSPYWRGSQGTPLYVLLIGDASGGTKTSPNDLIPVQMIQTTKFGPAASDYWYVQMSDNDIIGDLFIGRLPVTTTEELNAVIDKIIRYETTHSPGDWKNKITFIGGSQETRGIGMIGDIPTDVFRYQSSKIINETLPARFSNGRIYAYPLRDRFFGGANEVIRHFSEGRLIVNYLGHGGGGIWGDLDVQTGKPLLNDNQVQSMASLQSQWPLVMSMTCFVGAFDNDGRALGEVLLKAPNKGAVGVYAASGVGWIRGDYQLLDQTLPLLLLPDATVGSAIAYGKIRYLTLNGQNDYNAGDPLSGVLGASLVPPSMVFQFNFLGDPALKLQTPSEQTCEVSNYSPLRHDSITITGLSPFSNGNGILELFQLRPVRDSVVYGANMPTYETVYSQNFTITNYRYTLGISLQSLPDSIIHSGYTGVRIFGESSNAQNAFSTSTAFQIEGAYITDVQTVPALLTSSDSFCIRVKAAAPQGIQYVLARHERIGTVNIPGLVDTLYSMGNHIYISRYLGPYNETDQIRYRIVVTDINGDSTYSPHRYENTVLPGIDLNIGLITNPAQNKTDRIYLSGTDRVRLYAVIENRGVRPVSGVPVRFYLGDPRTTGVLIGEDTVSLGAAIPNAGQYPRDTASILCGLNNGIHPIYVWVDSTRVFNDINRNNNLGYNLIRIDHFHLTPEFGTTLNFEKNDTVFIDPGFAVSIAPSVVTQNAVLKISSITAPSISGQPDIRFAKIQSTSAGTAYFIETPLLSSIFSNQQTVTVIFRYDTLVHPFQTYRDSLGIYVWDRGNKRWRLIGLDQRIIPGEIHLSLSRREDCGLMTIMLNRDRTPPVIEPNIEGQYFSPGAIVSRNPKISAILYDRNGVSLLKSDYHIQIDGQPLQAENIILPDSTFDPTQIALSLNLPRSFDPGQHTVIFRAKDVNGNETTPLALNFQVVSRFNIRLIGNFPNPFSNTTTIAYRIEAAENLDFLSISIYTVSGRRIRRITSDDPASGPPLNAIGYHEVLWDALDDNGRGVANGIYFYLIKGRLNGKTVERKGKIAYFR